MLVVVILVWTKDCFPTVEGSNRMPREAEVGVSRGGGVIWGGVCLWRYKWETLEVFFVLNMGRT